MTRQEHQESLDDPRRSVRRTGGRALKRLDGDPIAFETDIEPFALRQSVASDLRFVASFEVITDSGRVADRDVDVSARTPCAVENNPELVY